MVFFSTDVDGVTDLTLGRHRGSINKLHESLGHRGRTNYHWAMDKVIDHYLASGSDSPALVVFQTDGGPTGKLAAERYLCKAARLPLFWQFIGFGDPNDNDFAFLRKLDTLTVPNRRIVDNAGFFHAGGTPQTTADHQRFNQLLQEFPQWLTAAHTPPESCNSGVPERDSGRSSGAEDLALCAACLDSHQCGHCWASDGNPQEGPRPIP